jgi:hypothetical protein
MFQRSMILSIVTALSVSFAVMSLDAQGKPGGIIMGTIAGPDSQAVVGVNIVVEGTTLGTASDTFGKYVIVGVPPGSYKLKVTLIGYLPGVSESISVREGRTTELNVSIRDEGVRFEKPREQSMARPPEHEDYPKFPWPPPKSSALSLIGAEKLRAYGQLHILGDVAKTLEAAMDSCGYAERKYYWVPKGFAIVSRIEQIELDGAPKEGKDRWSINIAPPKIFSPASLLKAIFAANTGHFRIVVFVVTCQSFTESDSTVEKQEAVQWLHRGMQSLPASIGDLPYTASYTCTALIYEFVQATPNHAAQFVDPSNITGRMHLEKARLWEVLVQ